MVSKFSNTNKCVLLFLVCTMHTLPNVLIMSHI